ncbi:MAG: DNA/RNA non-specific endonuclease [Bacteroidota bacterium]
MSRLLFYSFLLLCLVCGGLTHAQDTHSALERAQAAVAHQQQLLAEAELGLETARLAQLRADLLAVGLPTGYPGRVIEHSALYLAYDEKHEQARWVAHQIHPAVTTGTAHRSNDFRPDPAVSTGTAVEADYFLKELQPDSTYAYDGYGFDRGHLAPSADFRWSQRALSESYFYSNMSPQRPEFNREGWAGLERALRAYMHAHPSTPLYVVTGPVLKEDLPRVERSPNGVSIPEQFFKVVYDPIAGRMIAFLAPNAKLTHPLEHYATTVDAVEAATGLDFFPNAPTALESTYDPVAWLPSVNAGDVAPLDPHQLPHGVFNTVQAKAQSGREVTVAGTVVSTRYARSGNLWLNLDKQFPHQIFSVYIRKQDLANFSYDPEAAFSGKQIMVTGKIRDFNGVPTLRLEGETLVEELIFPANK